MSGEIVAVFTDGGCLGASRSAVGGSWAWVGVDACDMVVREESGLIRVGDHGLDSVTANLTEFYAMLMALEAQPDGWAGKVCADSGITLGRWFASWKLLGVPQDWRIRMGACLARLGRMTPVQHDGHPTIAQLADGRGKRGNLVSPHNVRADVLCGLQLRRLAEGLLADTVVVDEAVDITPETWDAIGKRLPKLEELAGQQLVELDTGRVSDYLAGLPSVSFEVDLSRTEPSR
jgi:hypothetical protein